ncbi:MAG: hypothetical protein K2X81_27155, partial [Candidatus Obscuribacterales bacterium]|nr:hypothetical protein [Candidatus Obscuribacterales bacterium]
IDFPEGSKTMQFNRIALAAVLSLTTICPPAFCGTFDDLLRSYLGAQKGGNQGDIPASEQGIIKINMNTRQAQLESQLNAGVQSGQLSSGEEQDLRSQLNHIGDLQGSYLADGSYSGQEVQSMLQELNNFSARMNTYLSNGVNRISSSVNIPGRGPGSYGGQNNSWYHRHDHADDGYLANLRAFQADIDTKQAHIDAQITAGVSSGQLNWSQSSQLKAELNKIASEESQFTSHGRMSKEESQQLISELDALSTKVTTKSQWQNNSRRRHDRGYNHDDGGDRDHGYNRGRQNDRGQDYAAGQSLLKQRILLAISSGKFSRFESKQLLADESRMQAMEDQLKNPSSRLSFDEQRDLFNQLDLLSKKLNKQLYDHQAQ